LYVHNGAWTVADSGTGRGTYVNGKKITAPVPLKVGDLIVLGKTCDVKPPTLRILEQDLALAGDSLPANPAASSAEAKAPPSAEWAPADAAEPQLSEADDPDLVDLGLNDLPAQHAARSASSASRRPRARARTRRSGALSFAVGGLLAIGIVGATGWGIYRMKDRLQQPTGPRTRVIVVREVVPSTRPTSHAPGIF
jgi:hypothetical protein